MRLIDADALMETMRENSEGNEGWYGDTWQFMRDIDNAPTIDAVPHWVPCEERLPEEYGEYLVTMNDGSVQECGYVPENNRDALIGGWNTCESTGLEFIDEWDVIAWMPLPEPYREREGEQPERSSE